MSKGVWLVLILDHKNNLFTTCAGGVWLIILEDKITYILYDQGA